MTRSIRMPAWLHEVFGEEQRGLDLLAIIAFGLVVHMVAVALEPTAFAALGAHGVALDTENPANVLVYEKLGFSQIAQLEFGAMTGFASIVRSDDPDRHT